ncbi:RagB/SusD family nutrient uptake outer membrane protein [Chitinophaga sp. LS1]|uniref:RagB/SusD family nutrient uptake outer membrane protein n=1 Tax=Chitinophaga sp. LS1 TaxID=3051176 RepID=UPI002AABBE96|nr:RagB/SusD family nutrient uptake outer membrane protein [Chitinophaga sp. LS1]WPV67606.1 RagB/SusD family nutrient uptake outer membrane protein [Chitinophaga sp. LS1]
MQQYITRLKWTSMALVLWVLAGSCSKELEQRPVSTADRDAIFGNEAGLKLYANSFYDVLPAMGDVFRGDAMADYSAVNAVPDFLRDGAYNSRVQAEIDNWKWTKLRNINYFLANNTNPAVGQTIRENYSGLARFFRAWFYFDKVKRYGDVPWIGTPLGIADSSLYAARDSRKLVMDSIIADLDYAAAHISLNTDATASQITKYTAYALKSRVCLFEGTFRKYHTSLGLTADAPALLQAAADAAKVVMDQGGFSLNQAGGTSGSYRQLFISASPVTTEVMLSNVASSTLAVFNDANWYYTSATYGVRLSLTRKFINTYLNIDGTPFTSVSGYETKPFVEETKNRDLRLSQTIRMGSYTRTDNGKTVAAPPVFSYTYTGYMPKKWCLDDTYYDGGSNNTNSICIMRYAEILLNYAEAKAELGTLTDADWAGTVGALRARAGITSGIATKPTVADQYLVTNYFNKGGDPTDPSILEIRRERGIELVLEGFRFYDLVRWNDGELLVQQWNGMYVPALDVPMDLNGDGVNDVCFYQTLPATQVSGVTYISVAPTVNGVTNPTQLSHGTYGEIKWLDNISRVTWADFRYLYPLPYTELQLNTKLVQNVGWENL